MVRLVLLISLSLLTTLAVAQGKSDHPAVLPEHTRLRSAEMPNTPANRLLTVLYSKLEYPAVAMQQGVDGAVYAIVNVDEQGVAKVEYTRYYPLELLSTAVPDVPEKNVAVMTGYRPSYGPAPMRTTDPDQLALATDALEVAVKEVFGDFPSFEPALIDGVPASSQFTYLVIYTLE